MCQPSHPVSSKEIIVSSVQRSHPMQKRILITLLAGLISSPSLLGMAQQTTPKIKEVPIQPTSPISGEQMYSTYCDVCHGAKATGNGPPAPAMKAQPPDLTMLSKRNGGAFPAGNAPPFLLLSMVRSGGWAFIAGAGGPLPVALAPWQTSQ